MSRATFAFTLFTDDGDEIEHSVPARFVVCPTCEGRGSHVNRNIDGNGLTREDFDEDPDFAESYLRGDYDVTCEECSGERVVAAPDLSRCSFADKRALVQRRRIQAEIARDDASERRLRMMESGERW